MPLSCGACSNSARPVPHQRQLASRVRAVRALPSHTRFSIVARSAFDETPTEPVSSEQRAIGETIMQQMKDKISEALEAQDVTVSDKYGNHQHVSIDVVSELFEGKSAVQRQRMVYKAIWLELQDTVHAVDAMTTKTPAEASS